MDGGWCGRGAFSGLNVGEGGWLGGRGGEAEGGRLDVIGSSVSLIFMSRGRRGQAP